MLFNKLTQTWQLKTTHSYCLYFYMSEVPAYLSWGLCKATSKVSPRAQFSLIFITSNKSLPNSFKLLPEFISMWLQHWFLAGYYLELTLISKKLLIAFFHLALSKAFSQHGKKPRVKFPSFRPLGFLTSWLLKFLYSRITHFYHLGITSFNKYTLPHFLELQLILVQRRGQEC